MALLAVVVAVIVNHIVSLIQIAIADQNVEKSYTKEEAEVAIREVLGNDYEGEVKIDDKNLHIDNSASVHSRYDRILISKIYQNTVDENGKKLTHRSTYSLSAEWAGHNILASFGIKETQTKHVDLDANFEDNAWYTILGTWICELLGVL